MRTPDSFQTEIARLALAAAREHGFALAGGHALIAHGIVSRFTEDIDLFTTRSGGIRAAAGPVAEALSAAGLTVEQISETSELAEVFYGFEESMVEFLVGDGERGVRLQLVLFEGLRSPVTMEIGPVLHLDDVLGTKVAALATRAYPRDFIDVGAALGRYSREELLDLGRHADPALTEEDFAAALSRFDLLDDSVFMDLYGISRQQVTQMRARFADWPRSA
jgi:Nucleotidyl transferase AbiEii toxin, Type IV TA system